MVKDVSTYFKSTVNPSLELVEKGLEKLEVNFIAVNPDIKIKPEVCHLKHPNLRSFSFRIYKRLWKYGARISQTHNNLGRLLLHTL